MITILYYRPLVTGGSILPNENLLPSNIGWEKQAYGNYWGFEHRFNCSERVAERWLEEGLGRHVEIYSPSTSRVFEGFADTIEANIGSKTEIRGSLIDSVANRIRVLYAPMDFTTDQPTTGVTTSLGLVNDTVSQAKYGIIERVLTVSDVDEDGASQQAEAAILEHAEPDRSESDNLESGTAPSVTVSCLGYHHWLKTYTVDLTTAGTQNADVKIEAVLAADPNSIFSTDYAHIEANAVAVGATEDQWRTADTIIKGIVALGGASYERWLFGFGNDRVAYYKAAPTNTLYQRRLAEPEQRLERYISGQRILPWDAQVGEWVFYCDSLPGRADQSTTDRRTDPRYLFIESAEYNAPWGLTLEGSRAGKLSQMIAQYGLAGQAV